MYPFHRCGKRATSCHGPKHGHFREGRSWRDTGEDMDPDGFGGGGFGVRRPLRFLANNLELNDSQITELARILDELKTERAQAEVDRRRTVASFADALIPDTFDEARATEGAVLRVQSAERLRDSVLKSLRQIHALLTPEQRGKLAYLIRTGTLAI
jgi:Spy/CpxP family protein refolding chaperone